jgi:hypothetical protein
LFNIYHKKNDIKELKYLLSLLNSKLLSFYGVEKEIILVKPGKTPQIRSGQRGPIGLKQLPIKKGEYFEDIVDCVDLIIEYKKINKDTLELQLYIDTLIYKTYEIEYDEVFIIDKQYTQSQSFYDFPRLPL